MGRVHLEGCKSFEDLRSCPAWNKKAPFEGAQTDDQVVQAAQDLGLRTDVREGRRRVYCPNPRCRGRMTILDV